MKKAILNEVGVLENLTDVSQPKFTSMEGNDMRAIDVGVPMPFVKRIRMNIVFRIARLLRVPIDIQSHYHKRYPNRSCAKP